MRRLAFILLRAHGSLALAADWARLAIFHSEDQYFYDRSKLVVENNEITYWEKALFKPPRPVKTQLASLALMRERIDCREPTLCVKTQESNSSNVPSPPKMNAYAL